MKAPRQLVLELPLRAAVGRDDFLVSDSNAAAVAMIDRWKEWPSHLALLVGPAGSGKSHLVEVWRTESGARVLKTCDLDEASVPKLLSAGAVAIEDLPGPALNERALFHLLNLARQEGGRVLLTSDRFPAHWDVRLADLISRLRAAPVTELGAPDDDLLRGVLVKLFADRQLAVDESVISFLLVRMPRSLDAARRLVAAIDHEALVARAEITRNLAARVIENLIAAGWSQDEDEA